MVRAGAEGANFPSARYRASTVCMAKQETVTPQKRRGPAPTGKGTPVVVRMQPGQLTKVDSWAAEQDDEPSRPEAVRRLVDRALGKNDAS